jgi:hypothetical protein
MLLAQPSKAAIEVTDIWFENKLNQSSDNSGEFLFNRFGGATTVDVGDILITLASIDTNENLTDGGAPINYVAATGHQLTAVAVIEVLTKVPGGVAGTSDFTFGPVSAAGLAAMGAEASLAAVHAEVSSWAGVTVVALYDDPVVDFSRTGAGDDGGPADTGVGPFASESALFTTANNGGQRILEMGFSPLPGTTLFWVANDSLDDISIFSTLPAGTPGGQFNFGLNLVPGTNATGFEDFNLVGNFNPLLGLAGLGLSQFHGQGGLLGIGGASTPLDAFDNIDVTFSPTPEPSSLIIFGFGSVIGMGLLRRSSKRRSK